MALKTDPRYGYYPWWPEDGDEWVHPEDVASARGAIPSMRVWRRDGTRGPFVVLSYGDVRIRVRRVLWVEIRGENLEIGDWVEVLSRMQQNTHRIGRIREMLWDAKARAIRYQLDENQEPIPNFFSRSDLRPVKPVDDS